MVADGGYVRIGDTEYTFTITKIAKENQKFIDISDLVDEKGDLKDKDKALDIAAERLTCAAKDNKTYTVGHSNHDGATITVTENPDYTKADNSQKYDLTTKEGIEASLEFGTVTKNSFSELCLVILSEGA